MPVIIWKKLNGWCDLAAFIDRGKIVENGTMEELFKNMPFCQCMLRAENCLPENISQYGESHRTKRRIFHHFKCPLGGDGKNHRVLKTA